VPLSPKFSVESVVNAGIKVYRERPSQVMAHRMGVVRSKDLLHLPSRGEIIRMFIVGLAKRIEEV
jgi:hypothetical protein